MEIKPNTQKNFIIARVTVNKDDLIGKKFFSHDNAEIVIPMGYSLYYTYGYALELLETGQNQTIKSAELVKKIKDAGVTTLYWLRNSSDNNYEITVPWGIAFPKKGTGYNGQIKLKFNIENSKCKFISQCMCACETETKDDLNYEYLSEYYVNEKNEPKGLSVAIREFVVSHLASCENTETIKKAIASQTIGLSELGLLLVENSIVVNEFSHLREGGK